MKLFHRHSFMTVSSEFNPVAYSVTKADGMSVKLLEIMLLGGATNIAQMCRCGKERITTVPGKVGIQPLLVNSGIRLGAESWAIREPEQISYADG